MEYTKNPYTCKFDNSFNSLSIFSESNQLFQTIKQSFYIELGQISIRTRNKTSAGVLITRGSGRGVTRKNKFSEKNLTVPKIVAQCQKTIIPYLCTLRRTRAYAFTLPIAFAYLYPCIHYINTCITYLTTLTRFLTLCSIS